MMAGGGHGWHTPAAITFFSVVALPFVGVARLHKDQELVTILVVVALVFDSSPFQSVVGVVICLAHVEVSRVLVLMWAALWVGWQCFLILVQKGIRADVTDLSRR